MFWKTDFLNNAARTVANMIKSFEYEIDGSWKTAAVISSGQESVGNIYSYFILEIPSNVSGTITGFRVVGVNDQIIGSKTESIIKSNGTAMIYKFKMRIREEEE